MSTDIILSKVLDEFWGIAAIPRPSHHEEKIAKYLCDWAAKRNLKYELDELGDVIIEKSASVGYENAPAVILQAHMDMVCVAAEGVEYNPLEDPIKVINDGINISADGTSLGADDGIGIALALYLLNDDTLAHGPLKALFTVNEEDGMSSGAIDPKYLDAKYLINLDWEWLGSLCNSSAGGDFMSFEQNFERIDALPDGKAIKIEVSGLLGGHSGVDIHRGRGNAIILIAKLLAQLAENGIDYQLLDFHGGQARNAIPASAETTILVNAAFAETAKDIVAQYAKETIAYFGEIEKAFNLDYADIADTSLAIPKEATENLLTLLLTLPNGVHTMSPYVNGLVESSINLGLLETDSNSFHMAAMARSCTVYRANEILQICKKIADILGFTYKLGEHSPAWAVNPNSKLTPLTCKVYEELTGNPMVVEPVHGALECGAFFEKNPNLDMIAIGPSLLNVHTPKETCDLNSVKVTADLIIKVLKELKN